TRKENQSRFWTRNWHEFCTGSGGGTAMSITAYKVEAVGHDRTGEDYGYVNIMYRYGNKQSCPRPD
ncbi:hypothetical protein EJMLMN_EJMLMN_04905, partial [Dysosmobacter welbionis]